jgi:hypothetical protein
MSIFVQKNKNSGVGMDFDFGEIIAIFPECLLSYKQGLKAERKKFRKIIYILIFQRDKINY